jgi:argininosuccinate lyase
MDRMAKKTEGKAGPSKADSGNDGGARLWDKGGAANELMLRFTVGDDHVIDSGLIQYDVVGTVAHAAGLRDSGILTKEEFKRIEHALVKIAQEAGEGRLSVSLEQEDSHTLIEHELVKALGPLGLKIHAGRSRNDQAVTMTRVAMIMDIRDTVLAILGVSIELCKLAEANPDTPMPGYTHTQRAMPSSVAAWALGYAEVLCERAEALAELSHQLGRNALGSGAGYGVPMKLARDTSAHMLGFERNQAVTAVQITRGLDEMACCQSLQLLGIVISRMAADLVLFASREFGFCRLPAELTTGSSIMPQKANPDLFELMRAKGAELSGHPAALAAILSGMLGGYQRDLQVTKRHIAEAFDGACDLMSACTLALRGVQFDRESCARAMSPELYATAAAYRMVRQGVSFREAYRKAAAEPETWVPGGIEPGADCADSAEYTARLRKAIADRIIALHRSMEGGLE